MRIQRLVQLIIENSENNIKVLHRYEDTESLFEITVNEVDYGTHGRDGETVALDIIEMQDFINECQALLDYAKEL